MTPAKEIRSFTLTDLRVERAEGKSPIIRGYASVFNSLSLDLGGFRERVMPGCFSRCLAGSPDVRALINHDPNTPLGRTKAGTLRLSEDPKGLAIEIDPPDTSYARDLMISMDRKDIDQMSFAFRTITDNWHDENGETIRDLIDADVSDVSIVTYPAYTDTTVALGAMQERTSKAAKEAGFMSAAELRQRLAELA
jgi:uncharacterized protein